ncbi:MAG: two-component sensor histidine kinase [Alphaproteobacteria bacterium]|nr:two-component sensor histidine kinase [Alphaproteobacteria bacterium]
MHRIVVVAIAVGAPSLILLAVLVGWGYVPALGALIGAAVIAVATGLAVGRSINDLAVVRNAVDTLGVEQTGEAAALPNARRLSPIAFELWLAILRLIRLWRARIRVLEGQLAAEEAIIAALPDPLIVLDERRRIVRSNAPAGAFVGAVSQPRDLATVLRNPAVLAAADAVLRGEGARIVDFTLTVPVERQLRARLARLEQPSLDGAVAVLVLHDITELRRAEQMRADFIANASHELRTPLATLIGFIETLRGPAREDAEARERFLAIMYQQALRMSRLVEDLLSLSRIELNEHVMPRQSVDLAPLLRHLAEALELRAAEREMGIRLTLPSGLPAVLGDRDELAQVFQNLVDNAIKYGRPGTEITVTADTRLQHPRDSDAGSGRFVSIAVSDQGEGIAREHLSRLTERFYRVDTARSREIGGTGLGLAIVKHIVNHHRGFLEIDSTPGVGSVFTVWLRLYPASSAHPAAANMS